MTLLDDIAKLREDLSHTSTMCEDSKEVLARHEEQISGARGLSMTIQELAKEIQSLRKAAYWVGGLIIAGSITFAFSVMALIGT